MTGAERYLLDQLDLCLAQGDIDEAERYAAELRQELDPAIETVAALNHEASAGYNGEGS
jgi:hypothetical protein